MIEKVNEYAQRITTNGGNTLTLIRNGGKVSVNITGPRGGNEQVVRVSGDDLLEMLDAIGGVSSITAQNYVDIVLDGRCRVCGSSINQGEQVCCDCLEKEIIRHKQHCPPNWHPWIIQ